MNEYPVSHDHSTSDYGGNSRAECQDMLSEFRVSELKDVLRKASQSQRGKKADLFQRASELLRHGSPKVQLQIREIYRNTGRPYHRAIKQASPAKAKLKKAQQMVSQQRQNKVPYVVHPDVKFKPHPFFKLRTVIIRPTALVSKGSTGKNGCQMRIQFFLSPTQVQDIYKSKNLQGNYSNQVILRFARQETSCDQEDFFPKECYVKANDNFVPLPGYNPQYSNRPDYKRNGKPVNLTNFIKTSASHTNDIFIYWSNQDILYPQGFCVTIEHVENLSSSDLLAGLKSKGLRSPEVSRALVKDKLTMDSESEISATSLRMSLICPLGKIRITNPCRAKSCSHLQCFDASIYLQMNERNAQWICPVCDKPALYNDLFIDGFFKEICEKSSSDTIEFSSDGSWRSFSDKVTTLSILTPDTKQLNSFPITIGGTSPQKQSGTANSPIVIDLTLSDSEDEEPIQTLSSKRRVSSTSSESSSSTVSNVSPTPDERDTVIHTSSLSELSSYNRPESHSMPVITNPSRSSNSSVIRQGLPPHDDVITIQHGYASSPHQQDIYHDSYNVIPRQKKHYVY